ncbi:MAG: murein biosynthesis integral membrane protein MurJ [Alphaproteobacteria bacterium]
MGGYTLGSRVLGFIRDILIAWSIGTGPVADAFFVALRVPNFMRTLFAEGAFNVAFVPQFAGTLEREGRAAAREVAEDALAVLLVVVLAFVVAAQIAMPWLMYVLAPGFASDPAKFDLTVTLTQLTFPYLLFISLASLLSGILNSLYRFAAAAATPMLLNVCMIVAIVAFGRMTETPGHALAYAVSAAGIVQFVWLSIACWRAGMALRLRLPRLTPRVRRLLKVIGPAALGAGVAQVNLLISVIIASLLPGGAVSYLYYADRINQVPIGVVGIAVGTALLPLLSRQIRAHQEEAAVASQNRAIEVALFLTLPAAVGLIVAAGPIIHVLFERGAFGPEATEAAAAALMAYAAGLPAFVLVKVLTPGYFAREDTKTPVKIAALCVGLNIVLNFALMHVLGHVGLALSLSVAGWLNVVLLGLGLHRRRHLAPDRRLKRRLIAIAGASAVMAGALYGLQYGLGDALSDGHLALRAGALAALVLGGLVAYIAAARLGGAFTLRELRRSLRRSDTATVGAGDAETKEGAA